MKRLDADQLTESERRAILDVAHRIKVELPVSHIILFGSKARGAGSPESDVDLLFLTTVPVTTKLRHAISDRVFDAMLEHDVPLTSIVIEEYEWEHGLTRHMLLHTEVQRDGCAI